MTQTGATPKLHLKWGKCQDKNRCPLNTVDLSHGTFSFGGNYLVWHGGKKPRVVYTGQARSFVTGSRPTARTRGSRPSQETAST